ncbi:hypothetical protein KO500_04070 [Cellulophaga baltica]|uniref:hypothetical protein n=1 Tax=Cellulophaga TaxID=104264 RepID=UPI001C070CD5|nr:MULTISPECIES: hypothetical protein [Cellulophaga]MBU2995591.1 hypothetical protein [Cellulophaga baltica]MDO6766985.1 hypothetical protein [Cellulophaga sp. 1_MG-2023]
MKKLILASVFTFVGLTAIAQEENVVTVETAVEEVTPIQDEYSEISKDELPEAVTAAVAKNYPTASIDKAHVNEDMEYKLEVSLEDGTSGTLYADEDGNWLDQ